MNAFLKSFFSPQCYPELGRRSGWSVALHYVVVIVVMSCLYAGLTSVAVLGVVRQALAPDVLAKIPEIRIRGGVASSPVEQPYEVDWDGARLVVDTEQEARAHIEDAPGVIVIGKRSILVKQPSGEIREQQFQDVDFDFSAAVLQDWVRLAELWTFPVVAVFVALWQGLWKLLQVLLVAGVVSLAVSGRPGFGTCLKMTVHALAPAMLFGVLVFGVLITTGFEVPMAWVGFYALLGGLPLWAARQQQARDLQRQRADFVPPQDL